MPIQPKPQPPYYTPQPMPGPIAGVPNAIIKISQTGTSDPVATTILNTLGTFTITRSVAGVYNLTFTNPVLLTNKTAITITSVTDTNTTKGFLSAAITSTTNIIIKSYYETWNTLDGIIDNDFLLITVIP